MLDPVQQWCEERRALRTAYYRAREIACALLEPHGLTPSRYQVLMELAEAGAAMDSKRALARKMQVRASSVHRHVRALERDGLVVCSPHRGDRRQVRITLTAKGKARFERARVSFESADIAAAGYLLQAAMGTGARTTVGALS
jgi:DNA-binding MarR family transcriptional regulator